MTNEEIKSFVNGLKIGDDVYIKYSTRGNYPLSISKIERITDTLLIVSGHKFRKKDLKSVDTSDYCFVITINIKTCSVSDTMYVILFTRYRRGRR
jgi:hypothetical protein